MSDDRFAPDDDPATPDRTYIDRKKPSWYGAAPKPAFNLADECEKFLAEYCVRFGIKAKSEKKKLVRPPGWDDPPAVVVEDHPAEDFER